MTWRERNLFEKDDAYQGQMISVTAETDEKLAKLFPEVDRASIYRDMDAWLWKSPPSRRPRNVKRFIYNWFKAEKRFQQRVEGVAKEIIVGMSPEERDAYLKRRER